MYPIWEVPHLTAGMVLALIATFHILPSHLSVGAMWFNVYIENKAVKERKPELLEFVRKYTFTILFFSYVLGSLSGVGIWFAATVASPRGISALIHNYVWGWASEWVFFIVEVAGIFIYYYTLNKVDVRTHLKFGWIFALASWITMIIITGILSFQLSSGKWPQTGNFFDGFFNQTYWQQLFVRTSAMVVIASGYAVTVASCLKVMPIRSYIIRLVARWGMIAVLATVFLGFLYVKTVPENASSLLKDPGLLGMKIAIYASLGLLLLYFIWGQIKPLSIKTIFSLVAIIVIFLGIWSGERIREYIRKPYVIADYMYSSQVIANDIPAKGVANEIDKFNQEGMLKTSAFIPDSLRIVTEENKLEAGRLLASIHCSACHTLDKTGLRPLPLMVKRMAFTDEEEAGMFLEILGDYSYMPQFAGDADDNKALSAFLFSIGK